MISLPYTICFCLRGDQVLMLYRSHAPNAGRWNGLGGKIEAGETPWRNIHREIREEAGMDLCQAEELRYTGLGTWTRGTTRRRSRPGMYAFLASFAADFP